MNIIHRCEGCSLWNYLDQNFGQQISGNSSNFNGTHQLLVSALDINFNFITDISAVIQSVENEVIKAIKYNIYESDNLFVG
jgi:hypothetical protein